MKKLGIVLDSFSGYSKKELKQMGIEYINQTTIVDGVSYKDGIDIIFKEEGGFKLINEGKDIKSSMPAIGLVTEKLEAMSKQYENVIYFTMNKGISSTYSTGVAAASDLKNVHVISNKLISTAMTDASIRAIKLMKEGKTIKETLEFIQELSDTSFGVVIPKDVSGLVNSGRVVGAKKLIFEKGNLIPSLLVVEDGFKVKAIKRNFNKSVKGTVEKIIQKIGKGNINKYNWEVIHTGDQTTKNKVVLAFKEKGINNYSENWASLTIAAHTGIGAIGISVWKK